MNLKHTLSLHRKPEHLLDSDAEHKLSMTVCATRTRFTKSIKDINAVQEQAGAPGLKSLAQLIALEVPQNLLSARPLTTWWSSC